MAKDPAFLFYPSDWVSGTMGMTFEEKGAYLELLMKQFNDGHMTTHMVGRIVGQLWGQIMDKFQQDEEGLWYNVRLDQEKMKRQKYTESRRNNVSGVNQHTKRKQENSGHKTTHMGGYMENENKNINEDRFIIKKESKNLIEIFFEDLPNSSYLEMISRNQGIDIPTLISKIPDFRKAANVKYIDFPDFCNHFKNWIKTGKPAGKSNPVDELLAANEKVKALYPDEPTS